jgi:hypothetical protein
MISKSLVTVACTYPGCGWQLKMCGNQPCLHQRLSNHLRWRWCGNQPHRPFWVAAENIIPHVKQPLCWTCMPLYDFLLFSKLLSILIGKKHFIWKQLNSMQLLSCCRNSKELSWVAVVSTVEQVCTNWRCILWRRLTSHPFQYRFSFDTFWLVLVNIWFSRTSRIPAMVLSVCITLISQNNFFFLHYIRSVGLIL